MRTPTVVALALAAVSPVMGYDLRQLWGHAASDPIAFCNAWRCVWYVPFSLSPFSPKPLARSVNYVPSNTSLFFFGTGCVPGDYTGEKNKTEALAWCAFTADGQHPILESAPIAKLVNAKLIPDTSVKSA
jgi:hypothetical protein